ncbi:MAG TPA: hypothetical protein VFL59_15750 [Candidatus Nanopelagicales bacterium]|nr:hypothetical protein [Candidatus Nanopelagicales bacterium]
MSTTASEPVGSAVPAPPRVPADPAGLTTHEVRVVDGRFMHAECSCGWRSAGRRNRATARAEARDHALLHAGTVG